MLQVLIFLEHRGSSEITVIYTRTWEGMVLSKSHYSEEISELPVTTSSTNESAR